MDGAFRLDSWLVDPSLNCIARDGTSVRLEPKVMAVLVCLAGHPDQTVAKEELIRTVWPDTFVGDDVLARSISELRRVFEDDAKEPRFIQTIPKRGYRLIAPVSPVNGVAPGVQSAIPETATGNSRGFRTWAASGLALGIAGLLFVSLVALTARGLRQRLFGTSSPPRIQSLAVLPMRNLSGDPAQDYFADAMTEELITQLSRISALNVISRTSVMPYSDSKQSLPEIARELHADAIVEGSVMRSGDKVRVIAQLIYAAKDTHIWAQTYDRDLQDALTLQSTVASAIAGEIRIKITPQERAQLGTVRPVNRKSLEAYLEGRRHLDQAQPLEFHKGQQEAFDHEIQEAVASFKRAIQEDPNYLPAYLGIFDAVGSPNVVSHPEFIPEAKQALARALELDESLVEAHLDMARLLMQWDWDYPGAGKHYQRALELNPNSADAHADYSDFLDTLGQLDQGKKELELAQELDPKHDRSLNIFPESWTLDQDRQFLDEKAPKDPFLRATLGKAFQTNGRYEEAVEQYMKAIDLYGYHDQTAILRRGYEKKDYRGAILDWMRDWENLSKHQYVPAFWPAFLYAGLGEKDAAFRWLEKAAREHSWCMLYLNDDQIWDPIRDDPRFAEFVRRAGLPEDHGQFLEEREGYPRNR